MKFITTQKILHKSPNPANTNTVDVIDIFRESLEKKGEYNKNNIHFIDEDTIELKNISSSTLHSLVLDLEGAGKDIVFEKSIIIKTKN